MIAKNHHSLKSIRMALISMPEFRHLGQFPAELAEMLLRGPAMVAQWILGQEPGFLAREHIKITVISRLDSVDQGAWWAFLGVLLSKPPNWAIVEVMASPNSRNQNTGILPAGFGQYCKVRTLQTEEFRTPGLLNGDLLLLRGLAEVYMGAVLSSPSENVANGIAHFISGGGILLGEVQNRLCALLNSGYAQAHGLNCSIQENMYPECAAADDDLCRDMVTVRSGAGSLERSELLLNMMDEICDAADDVFGEINTPSASDEVYTWGAEALLKSSLDPEDSYIVLPTRLVARKRTGKIYREQADLAMGDALDFGIDPQSFEEYKSLPDSWIARAGFVSLAWNQGLGARVNNTLGGAMRKIGVDVDNTHDVLKDFMAQSGFSKRTSEVISKAMSGGEPYAPSLEERQIFDLAEAEDFAGMMEMAQRSPSLVNAIDESRRPLILVVGMHRNAKAMRQLALLGANINARDGGGRPALVELAFSAGPEVIWTAIDLGADINARDVLGWTALLSALKAGQWESVDVLLSHGANPLIPGPLGQHALDVVNGQNDVLGRGIDSLAGMKQFIGIDIKKALKNNGFVLDASEIPEHIKLKIRTCAR